MVVYPQNSQFYPHILDSYPQKNLDRNLGLFTHFVVMPRLGLLIHVLNQQFRLIPQRPL